MATITLDAVDVIELAEILDYVVEFIDNLHITTLPACDRDIYNLNDLRTDVARLVDGLLTSPLQPPTTPATPTTSS
jgi:hypothetical protein